MSVQSGCNINRELVLKTAVIGEKAIHLTDANAWYVLSFSSHQAVGGLVLRQKLYSL